MSDPRELTRSCVLLVGFEQRVVSQLGLNFDLVWQEDLHLVPECMNRSEISVFVSGPLAPPEEIHKIILGSLLQTHILNIVLGIGPQTNLFQDLVDQDRIFYLAANDLPIPQLIAIVGAAQAHCLTKINVNVRRKLITEVSADAQVLAICRQIARQANPGDVGQLVVKAMHKILRAERAYCLLCEHSTDILWYRDSLTNGVVREGISTGLSGYVARTKEVIRLARVARDLRYDAELDNPGGHGNERFLAIPLIDPWANTLAVVLALRDGSCPEFSDDDVESLRFVLDFSTDVLSRFILGHHIEQILTTGAFNSDLAFFRPEAQESHRIRWSAEGDSLRITSPWLKRAFWLTMLLAVAGILFAGFSSINRYADGVVVIQGRNTVAITTPIAGLVARINASQGERVVPGDLIATINAVDALDGPKANSDRTGRFPTSTEVRASLEGVIAEILASQGQPMSAGDTIAMVRGSRPEFEALAFLPPSASSSLSAGMPIQISFDGYPGSNVTLQIDSVTLQTDGLRETLRNANAEGGNLSVPHGPLTIVRAATTGTTFRSEGQTFGYFEGLTGRAEVQIGTVRVFHFLTSKIHELLR